MTKQVIAYDDEDAMRKQLVNVFYTLRTDFNLINTFPNAVDVLEHIQKYKPDIVLLDIDMRENNEDGLIALHEIKKEHPNQKVMMLTTFDNDDKIFDAICLGADGYMLKTDFVNHLPHEVMRRSLNIIFSEGAYLTPSVAKKILQLFQDVNIGQKIQMVVERFKKILKPNSIKMPYNLKPIQIEILEEIVKGKSVPTIAKEKEMFENTINHHIKGIYRELEVHTRSHAVRKAIEEKIIKLKNSKK